MTDTVRHYQAHDPWSDLYRSLDPGGSEGDIDPAVNASDALSELRSNTADFALEFGSLVKRRHSTPLSMDAQEDLWVVLLALSENARRSIVTPSTVNAIRMALQLAENVYAELREVPAFGFTSGPWITEIRRLVRREEHELNIGAS